MYLDIAPPQQMRGTWVITADGEIDIATAPLLLLHLSAALALQPPWPVVLDLTDVTFLDSTGLSALVQTQNRAIAGDRRFCLVTSQRSVRRILEVTKLDQLLQVHSTLDSVLAEDCEEAASTSQCIRAGG